MGVIEKFSAKCCPCSGKWRSQRFGRSSWALFAALLWPLVTEIFRRQLRLRAGTGFNLDEVEDVICPGLGIMLVAHADFRRAGALSKR